MAKQKVLTHNTIKSSCLASFHFTYNTFYYFCIKSVTIIIANQNRYYIKPILHDSVIDMHGHMSYITHVICLTEFDIMFFIVVVLPLLW